MNQNLPLLQENNAKRLTRKLGRKALKFHKLNFYNTQHQDKSLMRMIHTEKHNFLKCPIQG